MKLSNKRVNEIINFIKDLNLEEKYEKEFTNKKISNLLQINQSLTHSSANRVVNYENLEFLGDAVLRLIASDFIKSKYPDMQVGERSELRSQLVSDQWLEEVSNKINIKNVLLIGNKALRYKSALQEWSQSKGLSIPTYKTIEINKKHNNPKRFFCTVYIKDQPIGKGWGKSMKLAEKEAANKALKKLSKNIINI